jgi:hypothetical protein
MNLPIIIICPHCKDFIIIEEINCRIFRHAVLIETNEQINPHASEYDCNNLIDNKLIYGCGKPFKLNENYEPEICKYI